MKLQNTFFTLLILFVSFQFSFGQTEKTIEMVDEFTRVSCDEFLARLDYFYSALNSDPTSQGFVVIYGENTDLRRKLAYELWTGGSIQFRNFDEKRITIIRGIESGEVKIQLWKIPAGVEKPNFDQAKWNFVFAPETKPYVFHDEYEQICSSIPFEKIYAEYLHANSKAMGHIVIYTNLRKKYEREKNAAKILLKGAPQNRLRFFHIRDERENVEYWLVPRKKR